MTSEEIKLLFAYNAWANNRVFEALAQLSEEQFRRDLKTSHGSILGTLIHVVGAEKVWLSRWLARPESMLQADDVSSLADLKSIWEKVAGGTATFVARLTEERMKADFEYANTKGERYSHPLVQSLQHVVNHSSYHRGQIASLVRQVGGQPVNTDLITFYRHLRLSSKPLVR